VLSTPRRFRESVGRYAAFLAACKARDGAAAERTVQESLSWAVERVAGTLPSESEAGA
jgi:DNA-binding GntR family transcriptional regulator